MSDPLDQERTRLLYSQLPTGSTVSVVNAAILCALLWTTVPAIQLIAWLAVVAIVSLGRLVLARRFRASPTARRTDFPLWERRLIRSNFISGLVWGGGSFLFFNPAHLLEVMVLSFVLAGMTAGAAPLYVARVSAYLAFIAPALLLFAARLASEQSHFFLLMAALVCIFLTVLALSARRLNSTVMESLRLRHANTALIDELTRANERIEHANLDLQEKVEQAEQAEQSAKHHRDMLDAIRRAQARFIDESSMHGLFDDLLANLIRLTGSEYGFIGEVLNDDQGTPYLRSYAASNVARDAATRDIDAAPDGKGREPWNPETLFGEVIASGRPVIANEPADHPSPEEPSPGRAAIQAFLGMPLYKGTALVGIVGIANRPGGYDQATIDYLDPFLHTCANLIQAYRSLLRRDAAERELEDQRRQLQAVLDNAAEGILTLDSQGRISSHNQAVLDIFRTDDLQQLPFTRLLKADSREAFAEYLAQRADSHTDAQFIELSALRSDGGEIPIEVGITRTELAGEPIQITVLRDITERKQVERMKHEFIATVSHELRTPLTALQGALRLMRGGAVGEMNPATADLLKIAEDNSDRLLALISDILDVERIEAGRLDFNIRAESVRVLLHEAVELNAQYAAKYQVELVCNEIPQDCLIRTDASRLQQVLGNLISNAAKFSEPGGRIELGAELGDTKARIYVRDSGCGIAESYREKVFDKFSQFDSTDARRVGGSGLGLSISKALVEQMEGEIGFVSEEGEGTEFFVDQPRADA